MWLPPRRPRVLAVELGDADGRLGDVQVALSDALHAGGWYTPEARPFLAHVTVARVPGSYADPPARASVPQSEPGGFTGSCVTLFRSHLGSAGAARSRSRRSSSAAERLIGLTWRAERLGGQNARYSAPEIAKTHDSAPEIAQNA